MRKFVLLAALCAGTAATPAMAQDVVAPGQFSISGIVGYDAPDGDVEDASGIVYGVAGGYDFNLGRNMILGAEAELTSSSTDECEAGVIRTGDILCVDAGRDIYVGGRVGFRFGRYGNNIVYAGAGYTNAEVRLTYDANLPGTTDDFDVTDELDGYRLKGGVEVGLGRSAFVKAEYRYSSYEDDFDRHQVVGGIGLRF